MSQARRFEVSGEFPYEPKRRVSVPLEQQCRWAACCAIFWFVAALALGLGLGLGLGGSVNMCHTSLDTCQQALAECQFEPEQKRAEVPAVSASYYMVKHGDEVRVGNRSCASSLDELDVFVDEHVGTPHISRAKLVAAIVHRDVSLRVVTSKQTPLLAVTSGYSRRAPSREWSEPALLFAGWMPPAFFDAVLAGERRADLVVVLVVELAPCHFEVYFNARHSWNDAMLDAALERSLGYARGSS